MERSRTAGAHRAFALVLLFGSLVCAPTRSHAQVPPVVEWVTEKVYVLEGTRLVSPQMVLTGTVYSTTTVQATTSDGTADIDDYVDTSTFGRWNRFESGVRTIAIEIRDDAVAEGDESFFVDLSPGNQGLYVLGAKTRLEVVIVDDDAGIRPYFEVAPTSFLSAAGDLLYLAPEGEHVDLVVRLSEPAPAGYSVSYRIDGGDLAVLNFDEGTTSELLRVDPPTAPFRNFEFGIREVELIDPGSAVLRAGNGPSRSTGAYGYALGTADCVSCLIEGVQYALRGDGEREISANCPSTCAYDCLPAPRSTPDATLAVLRSYRDQVLATTAAGQFYVTLYTELSPALARAVFADVGLLQDLFEGLSNWVPAFTELVAGNGDTVLVTPGMQASLLDVLDRLAASGEPLLVEAVQRERTRLMLDSITDLSMTQFQTRVETLGGEVQAEPESWGVLKSRYDD